MLLYIKDKKGELCSFFGGLTVSMKKRFSVIFLILILLCSAATFVACNDDKGESPIIGAVFSVFPKTEYFLGDKFELGDAELTLTYENGTTKTVPIDSTMVSDFDSNVLGEQTLTVKYGDVTRYVTVTVKTAPVYSLKVVSTDHKTEYVVGQAFDKKNLKIEVTYTNGYVSVLTDKDVTSDMISGFDSATPANEKHIVVSYGNKTCTYSISVVPKSVVNRELTAPSKKDYYVGDALDFTGGTMFVAYNDNSSERLDLKTLFEQGKISVVVDGEDSVEFTKSGTQKTVTVVYEGQRFPFSVNVYEKTADKLLIKQAPSDQIMGSAEFDFSDGVVTVSYKNGTVEDVAFSDERVSIDSSACDINSVGTYALRITVGGATISCNLKVVAPSPESLQIVRPEEEKIYQGKGIDFSQWKYFILLNNGRKEVKNGKSEFAVTEDMLDGRTLADFDFYTVSTITLPFKVKADDGTVLRTSVNVEILAKEIVSLTINNGGRYVYSENDTLSVASVTFFANYNNGDAGEVKAVEIDMLVDENGNALDVVELMKSAGSLGRAIKKVYVSYTDPSFGTQGVGSFEILLVKKATKIELSGEDPRSKYVYGESFDKSDWQVKITYADGSSGYVSGKNDGGLDGEEWKFGFVLNKGTSAESKETGFDKIGEYEVRLVYGEDSDVYLTYKCSVTNEIVAVYVNKPFFGFVAEGTCPDLNGAYLLAVKEDGTKEKITLTKDIFGAYIAPKYEVGTGYVSAFVNASGSAAIDYNLGLWNENVGKYYVKTASGYEKANGEYSTETQYFLNAADLYKDEWNDVSHLFFVKNGDDYRVAPGSYDENTEYFIANYKEIEFSYQGHTLTATISVAARTVGSIEITGFTTEYDLTATEWDYSSLKLLIGFNNKTSVGVAGSATGGDLTIDKIGGEYGFTVANGLRYTIELGKNGPDGFVPYDLETFKSEFDTDKEIFNYTEICVRLTDAANSKRIESASVSVYVFKQLIKEIGFYLGEKNSEGTFVPYKDQTVYVNEKKDVVGDGFALKDDGSKTANLKDYAYLCVVAKDGTEEFYALSEDKLKSLQISTYSEGSIYQSVEVTFALKTCSFSLKIRPDVITSLAASIITSDGILSVIEKTELDAEDVEIYAEYVDADGNAIDGKTIHLRQTTVEGYSKNDKFEFDENGEYRTTINVRYGGLSAPLNLLVKRKTLEKLTVLNLPSTTVYVETPFADPSELKKLDYTGGKVLITYDNGENEEMNMSNVNVAKNEGAFNTKKELTGGAQETQEIILSYTYYGVTKSASFNVIVKDRKYLSIEYADSFGYDRKFICEYGAEESIMPLPTIKYYEWFDGSDATEMTKNSTDSDKVGEYIVRYRNNLGVVSSVWPKEVGTYTVIYSYFESGGDDNNNAFYDDSVTLEITKKAIAIVIKDYEFTFGNVIDGNNDTAFADYLGKTQWKLTAVSNGIADGEAFCFGDTVETVTESVVLRVYEKNSATPITFVTNDKLTKLFIGIDVGEYVIKPIITLKEGNYELSPIVTQAEADFTVVKRKVVIAAESVSKIYGEADPDYKFRIYDYEAVKSALGDAEITEPFAEDIFALGLPSIGSKSGINFVLDETKTVVDTITEEYHLARDTADTENVADTHKIYSGATEALANYEVIYAYNNLTIKKSVLVIEGADVRRSYGTVELKYTLNGAETRATAFEFYPSSATPLKYKDTFEKLFADYFNDAKVFYYNNSTGTVTTEIIGNYDEWSVLYKNVGFFADSDCKTAIGTSISGFSYEGKDYVGPYVAIPCSADVGRYYCRINLNDDLDNYETKIDDANAYSFVYEITKVKVSLNAKSLIVTGSSAIKDNANSANGRLLSEYFYGDGVEVEGIDKNEFDAKLDEIFKNNVLGIVYTDEDGNEIAYKLSVNVLNAQFRFVRNGGSFDTGIHEISADGSGYGNFDVILTSTYTDEENYSVPYVKHFYDVWSAKYGEFTANTDVYASNAYVVVLPEFMQIGIGSNADVDVDNPEFSFEESYSAKPIKDFALNAFVTLDAHNFERLSRLGLSFAVKNKNPLYLTDTMLSAGNYDGTFSYSYFDTDAKNYIYLGDTMVLGATDCLQIVKYLFDETYRGDADNKLIFKQKFDYTVLKVKLGAKVADEEKPYDEKSYSPKIEITEGNICDGDVLNPIFDVEVTYIEKEKQTFSSVGMKEYEILGYGDRYSSGSFDLLYAGTYVLKMTDLGNSNYEFALDSSGQAVSGAGTIEIVPINIPVYINHHDNKDGDEFKIVRKYNVTGNAKNEIDTTWKNAASTVAASYANYKTTDCYIVKRYKKNVSDSVYVESDLNFTPSDLVITTANEDGSFPRIVKRNADTGEVEGYPVRYRILNSDYINYSVVFVYRNGGTEENPEFVEMTSNKYELVIKPAKVNLHNFIQINSKKYDGNPASVTTGLNNLRIIGDYTADKIQLNRLIFTFNRPEESMYVGSISSGYKYINDTETVRAEDNKTDVGILTVRVRYIDENQNENYEIIFGEEDVRYNGQENVGIFTIEPNSVIVDLKNASRPFLTRQYDGYGLTNSSNSTYTAAGSTLTPENDIIDSLDKMFYRLVVKYYGTSLTDATEAAASADPTKVIRGGAECGYDAGYYWYDFLGVFFDEASGKYLAFADYDAEATDWFSWNYRFTVRENKKIDFHGCDGIYSLTKRDVYIAINSVDDEYGTLIRDRDAQNAPAATSKGYTYYITYNGFTYKADVVNGVSGDKFYYDIKADINALGDENRMFRYSFYTYSGGYFTNISANENLKTYYEGKLIDVVGGFFVADGEIHDGSDVALSAGLSAFRNVYTNFNFVNAQDGISFKIRAREIDIDISIVNIESGKSEMIYGSQFGLDEGLYFKFELSGEYSFENGKDGYDENLISIKNIVNGIINKSNGRLMLEGGVNGQIVSVNLISNVIESAIVGGEVVDKEKAVIIDGIAYLKIGAIDKTRFPANQYDGNNEVIDRYKANGTDLESSQEKYSFNVSSKPFRILRRGITITGVERDYFNKDTDYYVYDGFINGVNDMTKEQMRDEVNEIMKTLDENSQKTADYIKDNTRINKRTGTWNSTDGLSYYVSIPLAQFRSNDGNYIVETVASNPDLNFSAWDGVSVKTNDYVYLPLTINKAKIKVDYRFVSAIAYGDRIGDNDGTIDYDGLTTVSGGEYGYIDHVTGETIKEEGVIYVDDDSTGKTIAEEQNDLREKVREALLIEEIRLLIASSKARSGGYSVKLYNSDGNKYVASMEEFDNFEIEWGALTYTIEKKKVALSMGIEASTYITADGRYNDYFTAKWSERTSFEYKKSGRLGYNVTIEEFSIYGSSGNVSYNSLTEQIIALLGVELVAKGDTYAYKYKYKEYATIDDLMKAICSYEIYEDATSDRIITSGGEIKYIALKDLESENFELVFNRKEIMVYPEIAGIGHYESQGTYTNLIPDTEASGEGVVVNVSEGELTVKDLSMLVSFNFAGVSESQKLQYIDLKTNKYDTSAYTGTVYNRTLKIIYDKDRSSLNLDAKGQPSNGDVIVVQIILEESFYGGESVTEIESNFFAVTIKKTGSNKIGYRETELDKSTGATLGRDGLTETEEMDEYLSQQAATYYLKNGLNDYAGKFDIINLRTRLLPVAAGSSMRNFEIILYENALGKLVLGFEGGKSYVRSEYAHYFVVANDSSAAEKYSFTEVSFYVEGGEVPKQEGDKEYGEKVDPYTYYEKVGESYVLTTDKNFAEGRTYYAAKADASGKYVRFTSENVINEDLVDMFDGASHSVSVYIDKVGAFSNVDCAITTGSQRFEEEDYKYTLYDKRTRITADRVYTVRVAVDNKTYIFTYNGEPYVYEYYETRMVYDKEYQEADVENKEVIALQSAQFFGLEGKTGIDYNSLKVMIEKYTVQNRLIRTATNENYIANVIFWPDAESEEDVPYITNEDTAKTLKELIDGIGNITISGGEEAMNAYNAPYNSEKSVISMSYTVTDAKGNPTSLEDDNMLGMYFFNFKSVYNYGDNLEYVLSERTVRVLVTENSVARLTLNGTGADSASPVTLTNEDAFSNDIRDRMSGTNELTYVFDSVTFDETNQQTSVIMLYFKLSDTDFADLMNRNEEIANDCSGVALRIEHSYKGGVWVTKVRLIGATQEWIGDTSVDRSLFYNRYLGTEKTVEFASDSSIINLLKISLTKASKKQNTTGVIGETNGVKEINDTVVAFRLYQHSDNGTKLVFEDYVDRSFGSIDQQKIEKDLLNPDTAHYSGVRLTNSSIRMIDFYRGTPVRTNPDYVEYSNKEVTSFANMPVGKFVKGDATFTKYSGGDGYSRVYMPTDKYDVPLSYKGNAINFRFRLDTEGEPGPDNRSNVIRLYFGMNTPYWVRFGSEIDNLPLRKQRGLMLEYDVIENNLYFSFFKYGWMYEEQTISLDDVKLNDGKEHQLTAEIDFTKTEYYDLRKIYTYAVNVYVDGNEVASGLFIPVGNDLTGLSSKHIDESFTRQTTDVENPRDQLFMKGIYYSAVEVLGNAKLTIYDIIGFEQE